MTKSFYSILNVSQDADPAVIEAAYRALMKKYHPDVLAGQPDNSQARAAEINQAFRVLRDPERRAQYDCQQQAWPAAPGPDYRPMPVQEPRPGHSRAKWIFLGMVAGLGALLFYLWQDAAERPGRYESTWLSSLLASGSGGRLGLDQAAISKPVSMRTIDRAIGQFHRIKNQSGLLGLSSFSQDCFAMRTRSGKVDDFDFCVAFDMAVLNYDAESAGNYALPPIPRFRLEEISARHAGAGRAISDDDDAIAARLVGIGALTRERLARAVGDPEATSSRIASPASVASSSPFRHPGQARKFSATPPRARKPAAPPRRQPRSAQQHLSDREFMEREGYIY